MPNINSLKRSSIRLNPNPVSNPIHWVKTSGSQKKRNNPRENPMRNVNNVLSFAIIGAVPEVGIFPSRFHSLQLHLQTMKGLLSHEWVLRWAQFHHEQKGTGVTLISFPQGRFSSFLMAIVPSGLRTATEMYFSDRIITPSITACPPMLTSLFDIQCPFTRGIR